MKTLQDLDVGEHVEEEDELPPALLAPTGQSNASAAAHATRVRAARKQTAEREQGPPQAHGQFVNKAEEYMHLAQQASEQGNQADFDKYMRLAQMSLSGAKGVAAPYQRETPEVVQPEAQPEVVAQPEAPQEVAQPEVVAQQEVAPVVDPPAVEQDRQEDAQEAAPVPAQEEQQIAEEEVEVAEREERQENVVVEPQQEELSGAPAEDQDLGPAPAEAQAEAEVMSEVDRAWMLYRDAYLAYKAASVKKDEVRASMRVKKLKKIEKRAKKKVAYFIKHPTHDDGRHMADARGALALVEQARTQKTLAHTNLQSADAMLKDVLARVADELQAGKKMLTKEQGLAAHQIGRLRAVANDLTGQLKGFTPENIESGQARLRELADEVDALRLHIAAACETLDLKSTTLADTLVAEKHTKQVQRNRGRMERLERHVAISEVSFGGLQKMISPMLGGDTGSMSLGLSVGVAAGVDLSEAAKLTASLAIKYSGTLSLQDDRKFRVAHKLALSPGLKAEIGKVAEAEVAGELFGATTEVFIDEKHWAAFISHRIGKVFAAVAAGLKGNKAFHKKVRKEDIEFAQSMGVNDKMIDILHLNQKRPSKVMTGGAGVGASAKLTGVVGGGLGLAEQRMHFTDDKGRTKTGVQGSQSVSAELGPFQASVTRTVIEGHANPDNDGVYRNYNVSMTGGLAAKLAQKSPEAATEVMDTVGQCIEQQAAAAPDADAPSLLEQIKSVLGSLSVTKEFADALPSFSLDVGVSGSVGREWNLVDVEDNGYQLQYTRAVGGLSAKAAASIPTSVPGLNVELGGSYGHTKAQGERLGTHTITYLMTVYNGLSARDTFYEEAQSKDPAAKQQWARYARAHRAEILEICRNFAAGDAALVSEVGKCSDGDILDDLRNLSSRVFANQEDAEISGSAFGQAVEILGRLFADLTRQNKADQNQGPYAWKQPKDKQSSEVGHLTARVTQAPWASMDNLRRDATRAPAAMWWQLATVFDPELSADDSTRTDAWKTGGVGTRARDMKALLDKGYLIDLVLPDVGRVTLTASSMEAALVRALAPMLTEKLRASVPALARDEEARRQILADIIAALLDADVGFEMPRPLMG